MAINPITIRGHMLDSNESSNLSIGRLWIGTDVLSDGNHQFNPSEPQQAWNKYVTFVLWNKEAKTLVSSDDVFIAAVNRLVSKETIAITVWGKETSSDSSESRGILFDRTLQELKVTLINDEKSVLNGSILNFNKFLDGLGHLYPRGEIECLK